IEDRKVRRFQRGPAGTVNPPQHFSCAIDVLHAMKARVADDDLLLARDCNSETETAQLRDDFHRFSTDAIKLPRFSASPQVSIAVDGKPLRMVQPLGICLDFACANNRLCRWMKEHGMTPGSGRKCQRDEQPGSSPNPASATNASLSLSPRGMQRALDVLSMQMCVKPNRCSGKTSSRVSTKLFRCPASATPHALPVRARS